MSKNIWIQKLLFLESALISLICPQLRQSMVLWTSPRSWKHTLHPHTHTHMYTHTLRHTLSLGKSLDPWPEHTVFPLKMISSIMRKRHANMIHAHVGKGRTSIIFNNNITTTKRGTWKNLITTISIYEPLLVCGQTSVCLCAYGFVFM